MPNRPQGKATNVRVRFLYAIIVAALARSVLHSRQCFWDCLMPLATMSIPNVMLSSAEHWRLPSA
eukprot:5066161-Pleurochrysis_carterae.AAC.1